MPLNTPLLALPLSRPLSGSALPAMLRPTPPGEIGVVYFAGGRPFEYHNDTAKTAAITNSKGWRTLGDIGYLDDDGFLFIVDRQADMVISGGVNIYPVEIEIALQGMPGVADCAVFGIPDDEFGEALGAAVQPAPGAELTAEDVRRWLHERIAGYKVPRVVTVHEQLPREDTGKIFKRKLREPYWEGRTRRV